MVEDGNFEREGIGIGAGDGKVGVGLQKEWFSGTRTYERRTRVLSRKEGIVVMVVFALLFLLIFSW